jgi:hypothetical protein
MTAGYSIQGDTGLATAIQTPAREANYKDREDLKGSPSGRTKSACPFEVFAVFVVCFSLLPARPAAAIV